MLKILEAVEGSNLSRGGVKQIQPLYWDADSNTHASEMQITLSHDGMKGLVGSLQRAESESLKPHYFICTALI